MALSDRLRQAIIGWWESSVKNYVENRQISQRTKIIKLPVWNTESVQEILASLFLGNAIFKEGSEWLVIAFTV